MRRITINSFGGCVDDRLLKIGDVCDIKVVESTLGIWANIDKCIVNEENGFTIYQNLNTPIEREICGKRVYHTFMRSEKLRNYIYIGLCEKNNVSNLDPRHGRKIFIISPYRGDVEANKEFAKNYAREVAYAGHFPIVPHLYLTEFLDDSIESERNAGIEMGHALMDDCDEAIVLIKDGYISEGMKADIEYAASIGLPITEEHF